jgi:Ca-activated chloride channel family protein
MHISARLLMIATTTAAVLGLAAASQAQEMIRPPEPPPHPVIQRQLTLESMRVDIEIDGSLAHTTIRQTLRNDGGVMVEGKYMLPLPPGASVSDFAIIDGDTRLTPEVLPADEARRIYQEIVRTMRDPGLLEYQDHNTFSVSVFPFQPNSSRTIEVSFSQALSGTTGLVSYNLPLRWAGWSRCRDAEFVLTYHIESAHDLGTISSPTHGVTVNRDGDRRASGSYEARVDDFGSDFTLNIGRRTGDFAASLMCFPGDGGEDGYFMLSLLAALPKTDTYVPKDVLFIFDKSGSMSGEKIEQAKGGLKFVIDKLKSEDRFNLVYYSDNVDSLYDGLRTASADNVREARDTVSRLEADGGTDINSALTTGAAIMGDASSSSRPKYVIFLTDGLPTVGDTNVDHIIANAQENFGGATKLFVFGVGYDVNTTLLDSLSYDHHGSATYLNPGEDIEVKVSQFYGKIASPALIDLDVDLDGLDEYDLMPRQLPDLFHNNEIFITGRYRGRPAGEVGVRVTGQGESGSKTLSTTVGSNSSSTNHQVSRLWATRKVSYLLDQIRLRGDDAELLGEIDRLAMRYGIVTPYTSYLITEPDMYFDSQLREQNLMAGVEEAREDESGEMAVGRSKMNQANQQADVAAAPQSAGQTAGGGAGYRAGGMFEPDLDTDRRRQEGSADPYSSVNYVRNQTFVRQAGAAASQWVDSRYVADDMDVIQVTAFGDEYFELLDEYPWLGEYLSQGESVVVVVDDDLALETTNDEVSNSASDLDRLRNALDSGDELSSAVPLAEREFAGADPGSRWIATSLLAAGGIAGALVLVRREQRAA